MSEAWLKYKSDFNAMSDADIETERQRAQSVIDEESDWTEAVAAWEQAGKPREMSGGITSKSDVMSGEPCVDGTRITVRSIADFAAQGVGCIKSEYPTLSDRQIADALA